MYNINISITRYKPIKVWENITFIGTANATEIDFSKDPFTEAWDTLKELHGSFAFVVEQENQILLVCDQIQSIPLYYFVGTDFIAISDDVSEIQKNAHMRLKESNKTEFLRTGYVTENETLFENIYQVMPGECVTISRQTGEKNREYYFKMWYEASLTQKPDTQKWITELDECFKKIFSELISRLDGRTAIIPLSGGCDSRTVAVMLKRLGYKNVICFSYGERENPEAALSEKIAKALGYKWYFVEYTGEKWKRFLESKEYHECLAYAGIGGAGNIAHLQTTPALLELLQAGKVPQDGVVIPGHTLDVSSGSHLASIPVQKQYSKKWFVNHIVDRHYDLTHHGDVSEAVKKWSDKLPLSMDRTRVVQEYMFWEWKNRQAKFITNDVRGFEYAGFTWELPFWDQAVSEFWMKVPVSLLEMRKLQYMYTKQVIDPVADVNKIYPYELEENTQTKWKKNIKRFFPFMIKLYELYFWLTKVHFSKKGYAFYKHLSVMEHIKYIIKYGTRFTLNSIVAEDYIKYLEDTQKESC